MSFQRISPLMIQQFEALASNKPQRVAVRHRDRSLTYGEIDRRSTALSHALKKCGVGPEVVVAVCVTPSIDVVVAICAIFKVRGVYMPIDPAFPAALVGRMLDEAQPAVTITHAEIADLTRVSNRPQLMIDRFEFDSSESHPQGDFTKPSPEDAAYLLYTSGTTGRPKGVVATQGNLQYYLNAAHQRYGFCSDDRFTSIARYTFSISLFDLLLPLTCGASILLIDRNEIFDVDRFCQHLKTVTVMHAGPSLLGMLFRHFKKSPAPPTFSNLRHVSTGGDMVLPSVMEDMKRVFPLAECFVIYGCTEISCMGTTWPLDRSTTEKWTVVGRPFDGVTLSIIDQAQRPVGPGEVGEIFFTGPGITRGYLDQPELTATKYVTIDGVRGYLTGDSGRILDDGSLEMKGRRDFQIQLRGMRIELGAIEQAVLSLGLGEQCIVVAKQLGEDDMRLVAYVVNPTAASLAEFRQKVATQLPDYMLPAHVVALPALPLTHNGKVDRSSLRDRPIENRQSNSKEPSPPQTEAEQKIVDIFSRLLGVADVGADDDFFDRGGHSLLAVSALVEIENALNASIPRVAMFEKATARALAARLGESNTAAPVRLNSATRGPTLFLISGAQIYRPLAQALDGAVRAYGVVGHRELTPLAASGTVASSVEEFAREYIEMIRKHQPEGPYALCGYSFSGIVAYEMAQQLQTQGERISFLVMIDPLLPLRHRALKHRALQLGRLIQSPPKDVVSFVWRRIASAWNDTDDELAPDFHLRFADDPTVAALDDARDRNNRSAAESYVSRVKPYDGPVTLFVPAERRRHSPHKSRSCGWRPFISKLEIFEVGGDHFTMLSDQSNANAIAQLIRAYVLARAMG